MCRTRAVFKSIFRKCTNENDYHIADKSASKLLYKNSKELWKAVKNINIADAPPLPAMINGATGTNEIVNLWKEDYESY